MFLLNIEMLVLEGTEAVACVPAGRCPQWDSTHSVPYYKQVLLLNYNKYLIETSDIYFLTQAYFFHSVFPLWTCFKVQVALSLRLQKGAINAKPNSSCRAPLSAFAVTWMQLLHYFHTVPFYISINKRGVKPQLYLDVSALRDPGDAGLASTVLMKHLCL